MSSLQKVICHDHRAVLTSAMEHGQLEATGIGAAACSRHGFFMPHAVVDFQLGERWAYPRPLSRRGKLINSTPKLANEIWTMLSTLSSRLSTASRRC